MIFPSRVQQWPIKKLSKISNIWMIVSYWLQICLDWLVRIDCFHVYSLCFYTSTKWTQTYFGEYLSQNWNYNLYDSVSLPEAILELTAIAIDRLLKQIIWLHHKSITRWTFFRVKLVFEYDFELSWSLGPWYPWTFRPLDLWTLGLFLPLPSSTTSPYFFLPPSSWFGLVWFGMVGGGG